MPEPHGRVILNAASGRSPWNGLTAVDEAHVSYPGNDVWAHLSMLEWQSQSRIHVGYFAYDLGRCFEKLPSIATDDLNLPLIVTVGATYSSEAEVLLPEPSRAVPVPSSLASTFDRRGYEAAVQRCLDYIAAGDVFQINLSQRLAVQTNESAAAIYRRLREHFPADYAGFMDFGSYQLLSNSPELFLRVKRLPDGRRKITSRPIKGTRPNAPGKAAELLSSEKDQAELAMIVDLQRNDLGRICEIGSVVVTEPRVIETHPTVIHGVATIEGILREDVSLVQILQATFPCGSITGCPKIRAMEIIEELEPVRRGAYCGAMGWIGGGEMELSVAIRTMTMVDGVAYVPVGGGIVADSVPSEEYDETMTKAAAMLAALGVPR